MVRPMALAAAMLLSVGAPIRAQFFQAGARQTPHPAVARVIAAEPGGASLGSGTLVDVNDDYGLVITNWHVVRDAPGSVIVVFPDNFQSAGRVLRMDSNWDLAAILIDRPRAWPVRVAREAPRIGEPLTIAGYGSGSYRAAVGACTQYLAPSLQHPFELVELAASARQGDSGGPIFNSRGELAGVLFGEGDGRTTGAYCGRVHSFLISAVEQLHKQGAGTPAGGIGAPNGANVASDSWRARSSAPRDLGADDRRGGGDFFASNTINHAERAHPALFDHDSRPANAGEINSSGTALAPVAAIAPSATPGSSSLMRQSGNSNDNLSSQRVPRAPQQTHGMIPGDVGSPNTAGWTSATESNSLAEQFFAGETLIAQLKTVLACVGVATFLFHGGKVLVRATGASSKPAKKQTK